VLPRTYLALGLHKAVRDAWAAAGLSAPPIQDAAQLHTVVSLVSARVGLGLVPASMREFRPTGVTYIPITGLPFLITTNAVWRDDDPSVTIQRFLALVPE
jgi:DNA-binding transcriptional LysR family regulator